MHNKRHLDFQVALIFVTKKYEGDSRKILLPSGTLTAIFCAAKYTASLQGHRIIEAWWVASLLGNKTPHIPSGALP